MAQLDPQFQRQVNKQAPDAQDGDRQGGFVYREGQGWINEAALAAYQRYEVTSPPPVWAKAIPEEPEGTRMGNYVKRNGAWHPVNG
jgi:hypothetical protein